MLPATALLRGIDSNTQTPKGLRMQSIRIWLPPVACCMAIQGFWLGTLRILNPQNAPANLQDLHRFGGKTAPTLTSSALKPRV